MVLQKQKKTGDGEKNQQDAANDVASMNFKPLGQVLRNVQCMACKKWGHARGERECELSGWNPFRMNTPAEGTPNNTSAAADTSSAQTTLQANNDRQGEEIKILHSERENKNRRKDDRHVKKKKKKTKKHKRRRRERSPSYSSDSYSSYDSYSSPSKEDHYKKRRRDYYSSDDSHNRHQSKTGRRQKSSRK
jgi:CBF1 interacting corepressor